MSYKYVLLMSSSFLMLFGVNLSFFYFLNLIYKLRKSVFDDLTGALTWRKLIVFSFGIGAITSVLGTLVRGDFGAFRNAIVVIPNYIYWTVIIFLIQVVAQKALISLNQIYRGISIGLIVSIIYYVVFQRFISNDLFFKAFEPNNFSFLLICLSPQFLYYIKKRFNSKGAYASFVLILILQLSEGRRAGFGLILVSGLAALNSSLFQFRYGTRLFRLFFFLIGFYVVYNLSFVEQLIKDSSPRIHQLVYEGSDALDTDRSYLTRLAMIEKGLVIFSNYPLTGLGLNNFTAKEADIRGDFAGSQFVINKDIFERTSSHNSYINILAEGGLLLFVPFILLLIHIFYSFFTRFLRLSEEELVMLFSMIVMSIHLYFMNAIVNSLAWFNISIAVFAILSCDLRLRKKRWRKMIPASENQEASETKNIHSS